MSTTETKETKAQLEARLAEERRIEAEAADAARAEGVTDPTVESEPPLEPEVESSPAPAAAEVEDVPLSPEESQEAFETEMERHATVMLFLFGEDAARFEPCPTCMASGFALRDRDKPPELVHHPRTRICELCHGLGQMSTGSRMQGQEQLACPGCNGQGFTYPPELASAPLGNEPAPPQQPALGFTPAPAAILDAWQRPAGHPHFGIEPSKVGV